MRYGFTESSFVVVDDAARNAEVAYATSDNWEAARKNAAATAQLMLANTWQQCPAHIREPHYLLSCKELDDAQRAALLARLDKYAAAV